VVTTKLGIIPQVAFNRCHFGLQRTTDDNQRTDSCREARLGGLDLDADIFY